MFSSKKAFLVITKDHIIPYSANGETSTPLAPSTQYPWTYATLGSVLEHLAQSFGSTLSLVVADDFIFSLSLPATSNDTLESIKQKASLFIPDDLDQTLWGYRKITLNTTDDESNYVQVLSLVKEFFDAFKIAASSLHLNVESIEPLSFALGRLYAGSDNVLLISNTYKIMELISNSTVVASQTLGDPITKEVVSDFLDHNKTKYSLLVPSMISDLDAKTNALLTPEDVKGETQTLDLVQALEGDTSEKILDTDIFKQGANTYQSVVVEDSPEPELQSLSQPDTIVAPPLKSNATPIQGISHLDKGDDDGGWGIFFTAFLIVLIIMLAGGGFYVYNKYFSKPSLPSASTTPEVKPVPTIASSSAPLEEPQASASASAKPDLGAQSIIILNGNGKVGEASKLAQSLKDKGYNVTKTGNADNYNYGKTELHFKKGVPQNYRDSLDNILKSLYDVDIASNLDEGAQSDVQIILGKS